MRNAPNFKRGLPQIVCCVTVKAERAFTRCLCKRYHDHAAWCQVGWVRPLTHAATLGDAIRAM
jgi:hypothetical protein